MAEDGPEKGEEQGEETYTKAQVEEIVSARVNKATAREAALEAQLGGLRRELDGVKQQQQQTTQEPPVLSEVQLNKMVEEGKIDQATATAYLRKQDLVQTRKTLRDEVRADREAERLLEQIEAQHDRYVELVPEVREPGSEARTKFEAEFTALRRLGYPDDKQTEVLAFRTAFGDPAALRPEKTQASRETHVETGGGGDAGGTAQSGSNAPAGTPRALVDYYQNRIDDGAYPGGWKDETLLRELKRAKERPTRLFRQQART